MTIFEVLAKRKTLRALKINHLQGFVVPGAGIEPARIAPLVFETSASTDSAIRAGVLFCSLKSGRKEALEGIAFYVKDCKGI